MQLEAHDGPTVVTVGTRLRWKRRPSRPILHGADGYSDRLCLRGQGPALLVPAAWISHLELLWQDPAYRAFFAPLAAARTVVQYDRPGCGLSESWPARQDLDTDLTVLQAVVDQLDLQRFDLLGISLGAPASIAYAARFPERVDRLILYGGYADGRQIASPGVRAAMLDLIRAHWGLGSTVLADIFLPEGTTASKALARLQREAASDRSAVDALAQCYEIDVSERSRRWPCRRWCCIGATIGRFPTGPPGPGRADPRRATGVAARQKPFPVRR